MFFKSYTRTFILAILFILASAVLDTSQARPVMPGSSTWQKFTKAPSTIKGLQEVVKGGKKTVFGAGKLAKAVAQAKVTHGMVGTGAAFDAAKEIKCGLKQTVNGVQQICGPQVKSVIEERKACVVECNRLNTFSRSPVGLAKCLSGCVASKSGPAATSDTESLPTYDQAVQ